MIKRFSLPPKHQVSFVSFFVFLLITFGLAWGILFLYVFLPGKMTSLFGTLNGQHPLFFLSVYSPAIAAFIIVLYATGVRGFRSYFSRFFIWRCSLFWSLFLIIGIPLLFYCGSAMKGNLFSGSSNFPSLKLLMAALAFAVIKGPVEEFGWRGLALPLLQRKFSPLWAGLILGVIWGFWHLPAFLLSGTQQSAWSFTPFFIGTVAVSVILTALFNSSRGSILLPAFFHFQLINPIWPDAQPYDTIAFVFAALIIIFLDRKTMFNGEAAVKKVI